MQTESFLFNTTLVSDSMKIMSKHLRLQYTYQPVTDCDKYFHKEPREFDPRIEYADFISQINNQGLCGSCWAFTTTSVLADNFAWFNNQKVVELSAEYLIFCDKNKNILEGCSGNSLISAWYFLTEIGTVSNFCMNYTLTNQTYSSNQKYKSLQCDTLYCPDVVNNKHYPAYDYKAIESYIIPGTSTFYKGITYTNIQKFLYNFGSIATGMKMYPDFIEYWKLLSTTPKKSLLDSIYKPIKNQKVIGGHAVKIIGWLYINPTCSVWILVNSWGKSSDDNFHWCKNGMFLMEIGKNVCDIENNCTSALPEIIPGSSNPLGIVRPNSLNGYICGITYIQINKELLSDFHENNDFIYFVNNNPKQYLPPPSTIPGKIRQGTLCPSWKPHRCSSNMCVDNIKNCNLTPIQGKRITNILSIEDKTINFIKIIVLLIIMLIITIWFIFIYTYFIKNII